MDQPKATLTAEAEKLLEKMRLLPPREPGDMLRHDDEALILELKAGGFTQEQIAERVGCHQATVSRTLAEYDDSRPLARKLLEARAVDMAKRLVADAKPETILRVLAKLDVVRDDDAASTNLGVQVVLGLGECPIPLRSNAATGDS